MDSYVVSHLLFPNRPDITLWSGLDVVPRDLGVDPTILFPMQYPTNANHQIRRWCSFAGATIVCNACRQRSPVSTVDLIGACLIETL